MVKAPIFDALLVDWFTKSLLPKISCDVAMSGAITEEDVIRRAQHLDLIYSQSGTLYDIILQAPRLLNDKPRTAPGPHVDGMIGFVSTTFVSEVVGQLGQLAITDKPTSMTSATNANDPAQSTDVNMVQTSKSSRRKSRNQRRKIHPASRRRPTLRKPHLAIIKRERRNSSFHA